MNYANNPLSHSARISGLLFLCAISIGSLCMEAGANQPCSAHRASSGHTRKLLSGKRPVAKSTSTHKATRPMPSYAELVQQARTLVDTHRYAQAYDRAMSAAHLAPSRADAYFFAGVAAWNQSDLDSSERLVKQAASLARPEQTTLTNDCQDVLKGIAQDRDFKNHVAVAEQAASQNQPDRAATEFEAAYAMFPARADIGVKAVSARIAMNDYGDAKQLLEHVMATSLNDADRAIATDLQSKISAHEEELTRREAQLSALHETLESARTQLAKSQQELQQRNDDLNALRTKKDEAVSQHDKLLETATTLDEQEQNLLNAVQQDETNAEAARNEAQNDEQLRQTAASENRNTEALLYAVAEGLQQAAAQKMDRAALQAKNAARQCHRQAQQARQQAESLQNSIDTLQQQIRSAEADADGVANTVKTIQSDIDKMTADALAQQQTLDKLKATSLKG